MPPRIALLGDFQPEVTAHRAIPVALELARTELGTDLTWEWLPTSHLRDAARELAAFEALWVVPASPYRNPAGVLAAIRFARESRRPFLGTCGGFQHAVIEFAQHVAGLTAADHAETNPDAATPVIAPLACALVETTATLHFLAGSRLHAAYGCDTSTEGYHCRYGLNPAYAERLARAGLNFTARDAAGDLRAGELPASLHPFFVGTLFQPERAALRGQTPPLVRAFVAAVTAQT
jgi:CTP synthase (UTP-ammonia lyase)